MSTSLFFLSVIFLLSQTSIIAVSRETKVNEQLERNSEVDSTENDMKVAKSHGRLREEEQLNKYDRKDTDSSHNTPLGFKGLVESGDRPIAPGESYDILSSKSHGKNRCTWIFRKTIQNSELRLHCTEINIARTAGCHKSWLKVTDGDELNYPLCGVRKHLKLMTRGGYLQISSMSESRKRTNGFKCTVTAEAIPEPSSLLEDEHGKTNQGQCPVCGRPGNGVRTDVDSRLKDERIVGGVDAALHSHPWQGGIVTENSTDVWCGAILISDQYLLTAAHCAKSIHPTEETVNVILGTNRVREGELGGQQRNQIAKVTIHQEYNPLNLFNDIALLKLSEPAELGPNVHPICISTEDIDYTGTMAMASGWGKLSEDGEHSEVLQEVEVEVVSHEDCVATYSNASVTTDHVCAGGNGKDTCQADSGGPLVVTAADGSKVLLGITSWGRGCARDGIPGVYVKVASYLTWISSKVEEEPCGYLTHLPAPVQNADPVNADTNCSCGVRNRAIRIIGGSITKVHEYPWQAALVGYYGIRPFCGASILSDRWLLTAAHCALEMESDDQVMLGEHDWRQASGTVVTLRRNIAKIIQHPDYNKRPLDSDVALLELEEPLDFSEYRNAIAPVCLPPANTSFENATAVVSGWGVVKFGGRQSVVLRAVTVPIISWQTCRGSYGRYLTENMICAGYEHGGKDACQGDSGGPLVIEDENGNHVLAGVVSWGLKCAQPHYPGVYAKVNNFLPWIRSHIDGTNSCLDP